MTRKPLEHPGIVIGQVFKEQKKTSVQDASYLTGIPEVILSLFFNGFLPISLDFADRLAEVLGTQAELWLDMQIQYYESFDD